MPTLAIVGAGPGVGAAVARRFGREGFAVALIARSHDHLADLVRDLESAGVTARGYAADVRDPDSLRSALETAAADLGPIEVLQYSPIPSRDYLKPVLETTEADLRSALDFSVLGPFTAVQTVVPAMRAAGRGTLVFLNGGTSVRPRADFAGTSIAFAGESAYAATLHDALADDGVYVAQLVIPGGIDPSDAEHGPRAIADRVWELHSNREGFRHFFRPME